LIAKNPNWQAATGGNGFSERRIKIPIQFEKLN